MADTALAPRLDRIELQLAEFGKLFNKVSELMERMIRVEEHRGHLERRTETAERAIMTKARNR